MIQKRKKNTCSFRIDTDLHTKIKEITANSKIFLTETRVFHEALYEYVKKCNDKTIHNSCFTEEERSEIIKLIQSNGA